MKFLVDQMLGTLAKWLRLCGLDTFYATQEISDDELLQIAQKEQRIIITRDKELHQRAQKKNIQTVFTTSINLSEQLHLVFQSFPLITEEIDPLTRCSLCNTPIKPIKKKEVEDQIPQRVAQQQEDFWICPSCHQIYWKGTHYQKILQKVKELKQKQEKNNQNLPL